MKLQSFLLLAVVATVLQVDAQESLKPGTYIIHNAAWPAQVIASTSQNGYGIVGRDEQNAKPLDKSWIAALEKDEYGSQFTTFQHAGIRGYLCLDQNYAITLCKSKFFWVVNAQGGSFRLHDKPSLKSTWVQSTGISDGSKLQLALYSDDKSQLWNFESI
ncbi:hypothetical protein EC991_005406 [Linnemannia zychae]|nr:hypothetical protein EC991_005406 [Linnemannia zychae]